MIINHRKQKQNNREFKQRRNASESNLATMLAMENSEEDESEKNSEEELPNPFQPLSKNQKLEAIIAKLKKDIAVIVNCGEGDDETVGEHRVFIRLDLLNSYIDQIMYLEGMANNENKLAKMLAHKTSEICCRASIQDKHIILKTPRCSWKLQSSQELEIMMTKLKKNISFILNYGRFSQLPKNEHRVNTLIDLLNNYVDRVMCIRDMVRNGGTAFEESLLAMQKRTNETLFYIREDVFKAYMMLGAKERYLIARQGGEITCIFTILGIVERELHLAYGKIHQELTKRNRNKNDKGSVEFRSLPTLKPPKHKPQ